MAPSQNSVKTEVYPFIDPKNFKGKLKGKTVFVTGAGGGIGRGISIAFAKAGANVSFVDLDHDRVMEGAEALGTVCDLTDHQAVDKVIEEYVKFRALLISRTEKRFGKIDVLVNNAGINRRRPFHMMSFETFAKVIEVNFMAVTPFW
jgi:NAD(P)-dependent dehydrogenase (short-subunit alcohol dehydrogenase family)